MVEFAFYPEFCHIAALPANFIYGGAKDRWGIRYELQRRA